MAAGPPLASAAPALRPVPRAPLHEAIAERLLSHVVQSDLQPGEKLPGERELARRLGVSRTTVRQAILVLQTQGILEVRHGGGTFLHHLDPTSGPLARVVERRHRLPAVLEARRALEIPIAALAAERRTDEQAEELRTLARVAAREQTADFTFFAGLVEASGNVVFSLILNSVRPIYFEHAELFAGLITPDQAAMYDRAAEAVAAGDADGAAAAVTELALRQEQALEESRG